MIIICALRWQFNSNFRCNRLTRNGFESFGGGVSRFPRLVLLRVTHVPTTTGWTKIWQETLHTIFEAQAHTFAPRREWRERQLLVCHLCIVLPIKSRFIYCYFFANEQLFICRTVVVVWIGRLNGNNIDNASRIDCNIHRQLCAEHQIAVNPFRMRCAHTHPNAAHAGKKLLPK